MKRNCHDSLPVLPLKKQKLRSIEALPTSSAHPTQGLNLATPLRSSISNSHWVTPSLRESYRNHNPDVRLSATPTSQKCTYKVSPMSVQKENLPHRSHPSRASSAKEKNKLQLKAILERNGQNVTGTLQVLLNRVADGEAHGKLGICPRCKGGKLKMKDMQPHLVYCSRKMLCGFQCFTHLAPRDGRWTCVSFDDEEFATNTSSSVNTATSGHDAGANIPMRSTPQMPRSNDQNTMYHGQSGVSSPPPPYWNRQRDLPHPAMASYTFCHPFPHHQPLYPFPMQYPPMAPHVAEPPSIFRSPKSFPKNGEPKVKGENLTRDKPWFPLSDPAYFPDRGARLPPPSSDERERNTKQDHKMNPGVCNHTPAEVAMATKAAKTALTSSLTSAWSAHEDAIVKKAVTSSRPHNFKTWSSLVPCLPGRTGKQIRDRWINHLNPDLVHTPFEPEEDWRLWEAFQKFGKSWKEISIRQFQSKRSENRIKNRWHSVPFKKFIVEMVGAEEYERVISNFKKGSS